MKWYLCVSALCVSLVSSAAAQSALELKKGDHVCIVGGTVAERMQHFGWLETLIHSRFPDHELVFRNLAYSGDEVIGLFSSAIDAQSSIRKEYCAQRIARNCRKPGPFEEFAVPRKDQRCGCRKIMPFEGIAQIRANCGKPKLADTPPGFLQ